MSKNKGLKITLIVFFVVIFLVAMVGLVYYFTKQTGFTPTSSSLRQYTGSPDTFNDNSWDWTETYPLPLSFDSTAIIGDYKIITETSDRGIRYGEPYCAPNTCSGKLAGKDQYGCDLFNGISQEVEVCSASKVAPYRATTVGISCSNPNPSTCVVARADCSCSSGTIRDPCYASPTDFGFSCGIGSGYASGSIKGYCQNKILCGGQTRDKLYEGRSQCWSKASIYYKENLVHVIDWDNTRRAVSLANDKIVPSSEARLRMDIQNEQQYSGGCRLVVNDFIFNFKPDDFTLNITTPNKRVVEADNATVYINITNNYGEPVEAELIVKFEVPTLIGSAEKTEKRIIQIPAGSSIHEAKVPTEKVTDKVIITPTLNILMKGSRFSGVNSICYGQELTQYPTKDQSLSGCSYVKIGQVAENPFEITIVSKLQDKINELEEEIGSLELTLQEKAQRISQLNLDINQQTELIKNLELKSSEQGEIIRNLNLNLDEQATIISRMQEKSEEQASIINNLDLSIAQQAQIINNLNLNIDQQLIIINNLNLNLQKKEELVSQLNIQNAQQQELVEQMKGSFAEQAETIKELGLTIEDDAELINKQKLSLEAEASIIKELRLNLDDQAKLINNLNLNLEEKIDLISQLKLSKQEQDELISKLRLNLEEKQKILDEFKQSEKSKIKIILIIAGASLLLVFAVVLIWMARKK